MLLTVQRRDRLDAAITAMAADSEYTDLVRRLGCLRGISTLTGFGLAVEIGDWHRFTGDTIGAFLGLVPTEHSSGQSRSQGSITKTGNGHARRLLVEAAWHHRKTYRHPGLTMRARWEQAPPAARARGHEGNRRLHQRWQTFTARRKKARHRQRRDRPRARRLGLVAGRARVAAPPRLPCRHRPGRSARDDPRSHYGQPPQHRAVTSAPRPAEAPQPNSPSCGNQPAHISLTARRHDTLTKTKDAARKNGPAAPHPVRRPAHPCPLDNDRYISVSTALQLCPRGDIDSHQLLVPD